MEQKPEERLQPLSPGKIWGLLPLNLTKVREINIYHPRNFLWSWWT